ncbi:MAG: IS91 family transposase [Bacteroidota bacterium]
MKNRLKRPLFEVAQVIAQFGPAFKASHKVPTQHIRTLQALQQCRTAQLGGHIDYCSACQQVVRLSYNSCRNRHCPKCGGLERELWIQERERELLPLSYYHVVFTIPQQLNEWCRYNPRFCYDLLFQSAWQTLRTFGHDQKYLGAQMGATMVLHTWGQNLSLHPHIHAIVPAGGINKNRQWTRPKRKSGFLFPVKAMSRVFRAIFLKAFIKAWKNGQLSIPASAPKTAQQRKKWTQQRYQQAWVVYAKAPFTGPKAVVEYLGRYTHKVAISNHRITKIDQHKVHFRYKDYRQDGQPKIMRLDGVEFLRRFCLHILPTGFRRMRHYGFLSNRAKAQSLAIARKDLNIASKPFAQTSRKERKTQLLEKILDRHLNVCTHCGAMDTIVQLPITAIQTARAPPNPTKKLKK